MSLTSMTRQARLATQASSFRLRAVIASLWARVHGSIRPNVTKIPESTEIEWGVDMDSRSHKWSIGGGPEREAIVRGRCKRCWGSLVARSNTAQAGPGIKCRVCGSTLEGEDAQKEWQRMSNDTTLNLMNMDFGRNSEYGEGTFVQKVFPSVERITEEDLKKRISAKVGKGDKRNRLTRRDFPLGSPGLLFLQAVALMGGVEHLSNLDEVSVVKFPYTARNEDGSLSVHLPMEELQQDPKFQEQQLKRTMGATMVEGMISAFACELAMKAISLTCKDEAIKTHDLLDLFNDLPKESRLRISADYPDIVVLMEQARQVFGAWRYFENNVGERGLLAMIDMPRAHALGRAARVIIDEGEMVGLGGELKVDARQDVREIETKRTYNYTINVKVNGGEWPPRD